MTDVGRDETIQARIAASNADLVAHGPRLTLERESYVLARGDGRTLLGGLGAMGVGVMWVAETLWITGDKTYAQAPHEPDQLDDFGNDGRSVDDHIGRLLARGDGYLGLVETPDGRRWVSQRTDVVADHRWSLLPYEPHRADGDGRLGARPAKDGHP